MKVFLSGGTGFMGSAVIRELIRNGEHVKALVRPGSDTRNIDNLDIEIVRGDITDPGSVSRAMQGCSIVYHLAAMVAFWVPRKERQRLYEVNVDGTKNVLAAADRVAVDRLIYTSTVSTIGPYGRESPTQEEFAFNLWEMSMDYERSKYSAEFEVWRCAARGLPVIAVLPTAPVGPRDIKPGPVGNLIRDFLGRRLPGYIDGGANFIDVDDLAHGHILAAKKGRLGERYILSDQNITTPTLFQTLEAVSGIPSPKFKLPYSGALALAHVLEAVADRVTNRYPMLTVPLVKFSTKYYYVDGSKARRELEFEPRSSPKHGIVKCIKWFLDNNYLRLGEEEKRRIRQNIEKTELL